MLVHAVTYKIAWPLSQLWFVYKLWRAQINNNFLAMSTSLILSTCQTNQPIAIDHFRKLLPIES